MTKFTPPVIRNIGAKPRAVHTESDNAKQEKKPHDLMRLVRERETSFLVIITIAAV